MRKIISVWAMVICGLSMHAQNYNDSVVLSKAKNNTLALYHQFMGNEAGLYNGPQYNHYRHTILQGNIFFETDNAAEGSVAYNGILYKPVRLLYDIVKEKLIVATPNAGYMQELIKTRIDSFSILNHRFINITKDTVSGALKAGFYELLHEGAKSIVYKKHTKELKDDLSTQRQMYTIIDNNAYFIKKGQTLYRIASKKSVLNAYDDHRKEIRMFLRKNAINIRNEKDAKLPIVAAYYETL